MSAKNFDYTMALKPGVAVSLLETNNNAKDYLGHYRSIGSLPTGSETLTMGKVLLALLKDMGITKVSVEDLSKHVHPIHHPRNMQGETQVQFTFLLQKP